MTLEEKVDAMKLTVELIYSMQQSNEQKLDALVGVATNLQDAVGALAHNSNLFIAGMDDHEERLQALEAKLS